MMIHPSLWSSIITQTLSPSISMSVPLLHSLSLSFPPSLVRSSRHEKDAQVKESRKMRRQRARDHDKVGMTRCDVLAIAYPLRSCHVRIAHGNLFILLLEASLIQCMFFLSLTCVRYVSVVVLGAIR